MDNGCAIQETYNAGRSSGKHSFALYERTKLCDEEDYVLGLSGADDTLAASLADMSVRIFKFSNSSLAPLSTINAHDDTITGIKFLPEDSNMLFTSSKDGTVKTWDTRSKSKAVQVYKDDSKGNILPVNCFDFDPNRPTLCGGTDKLTQDAFLLYWDRRSAGLSNSYSDSHTDDITDVRYHFEQKNLMISGSVDGLINIFDISESSEDDALINTINTESSVEKLNWSGKNLTCLTHTEEMQVWDFADVNLICSYSRDRLKSITDIDYFVDVVQFPKFKELLLMTGTSNGCGYIWSIDGEQNSLWSVLDGGHSDVIRCMTVIFDKIVTGGEDGVLCLWQEDLQSDSKKTFGLKQKHAKHKKKPY